MRKSLLTTIAATALIAGAGLAKAQQTPAHNRTDEAKGYSERQPGAAAKPSEHRPGAMQSRRRSAAAVQREHRSGQPGAMQGKAQSRSASEQNNGGVTEHRSVASIKLSSDQKARLHDTSAGGELRRVDHVDFALSAGTRVPGNVQVYPVPVSIVEIVPQYRGFDYIIVGDDLVIINPGTLTIVAVVPV